METIKRIGKYSVRLEVDEDAQSPADDGDTGAFLVGWHTREFYVAPPGTKGHFEPADVFAQYRKTHHIYMLEAYIHSGVRLALMNEGNFPDRQWDVSSRIGAIFLAKDEWKTKSKKARKYAEGLIETWNQYLSGDVYGYVIAEHESDADDAEVVEDNVESCWGFFGKSYAEEEAVSALTSYAENHTVAVTA